MTSPQHEGASEGEHDVPHRWLRFGVSLLVLVLTAALVWWATLPGPPARGTTSYALEATMSTTLGRDVATLEGAHPGTSGFLLLGDSYDAMEARAALAQAAERTLDVQYYLFHDDDVGRLVAAMLLEAADRGVRVRILVDDMDMGGRDVGVDSLDAHPNIGIRLFNPFPHRGVLRPLDFVFAPQVTRRMHNKSFIADNAVGIIGGRNIGDEYFRAPHESLFVDLDLLAAGPAAREISTAFDTYWNSEFAVPIASIAGEPPGPDALEALREKLEADAVRMRATPWAEAVRASKLAERLHEGEVPLVWAPWRLTYDRPEKMATPLDDPTTHMAPKLRPLITRARSELLLVSPYFVPGKQGVELLGEAVQRGARTRVLTNSLAATDVWIVHGGYARYRDDLLREGVELHELGVDAFQNDGGAAEDHPRVAIRLHAKTIVVDGRYVFIGSFNLDPRSALHNTEIGLTVDSTELARRLREGILEVAAPENSYRIVLEDGHPRWVGEEDGEPVTVDHEPDAGFWRRLGASAARVLPIEKQL